MVPGSEGNDSRCLLISSWKSGRFKAYRSINLAVASLYHLCTIFELPAAASGWLVHDSLKRKGVNQVQPMPIYNIHILDDGIRYYNFSQQWLRTLVFSPGWSRLSSLSHWMELLEVLGVGDCNWSFELGFISVAGLSDLKLANVNRYINFLTYAHGHLMLLMHLKTGKIFRVPCIDKFIRSRNGHGTMSP